jgi:hypothetical protein
LEEQETEKLTIAREEENESEENKLFKHLQGFWGFLHLFERVA